MSRYSPWLFIANPFSGNQKNLSCIHELFGKIRQLEPGAELVMTEYPGHAVEIARDAMTRGIDSFAVIGGDGTLNEVVNGIFTSDSVNPLRLTVVPWGTGNDWSAYYHISGNIDEWLLMFGRGNLKQQDVGKVVYKNNKGIEKSHYFINFVGSGFDTYVLQQMGSGQGKRSRYYYYLVKSLFSYRGKPLSLKSHLHNIQHHGLLNMVCIGKYGGAGMVFAPDADMNDGMFDVISLKDMPVWQRVLSLPYLMNGKIKQHAKVVAFEADQLEMDIEGGSVFQCDGEIIGELPAKIEILPSVLQVLVP